MSARIGYSVLSTISLKLGFCFALHHVLNRDALVWVVFLRLRHSGIVSVQNIEVDGMRWKSLTVREATAYDAIARNFHHTTLLSKWLEHLHGLVHVKVPKAGSARNYLRAATRTFKSWHRLGLPLESRLFVKHWAHHLLISISFGPTCLHEADLLWTRNCWV